MGLAIISILLASMLVVFLNVFVGGDFGDLLCAFCATVAITFSIGIGISMAFELEFDENPSEVKYIEALKDNSLTGGQFFLGTGTVESTEYYFYMESSNKGSQMKDLQIGDDVYVNDKADGTPRLEIYDGHFKSQFAHAMFGIWRTPKEYIFFVPKNTVTNEFEVDME